MSKATQMNNDLWLKEMMTNPKSNPNFNNFYKEELVKFCKIAKKELVNKNKKIDEAIDYIDHELNYHILQNDEKSWNLQFYTNGKLDYRKLLIALLKDILEILGDKENE